MRMSGNDDPASSNQPQGSKPSTSREMPPELCGVNVDDALNKLFSTIRLDRLRKNPPENCEEIMRELHERVAYLIAREPDQQRKRKWIKAASPINFIREQDFALIRMRHLGNNKETLLLYKNRLNSTYQRVIQTLDTIVADSFDEEYRKLATVLGVVDAIAELLVLEIKVYGAEVQDLTLEHRSSRKLIAHALTNLTFGNATSKRLLCQHDGFIEALIILLTQQPTLVQVYAGLIRNVSWMADGTMCRLLSPTCQAVAEAFVTAYQRTQENPMVRPQRESKDRELGAVSSTLSALWNLASHSIENRQSICETPGCLVFLAQLLTLDTKSTLIVESASGVLKYSTQYLSIPQEFHQARESLLSSLLPMLHSSSFTIISNALSAIENLISHDLQLQNMLRYDQNAFSRLNTLRNSTREDVRSLVKRVLNCLNNAAMYSSQQYASVTMSSSMGGDMVQSSRYTDANRLLTLRSSRASPGAQASCLSPNSFYRGSTSLPRPGIHAGHNQQRQLAMAMTGKAMNQQSSIQSESHTSQESGVVIADDCGSGDQDLIDELSDSMKNSRAPSEQSLTSMLPTGNISSGWESVVDTTDNSGRESPVSISDLPDSPTMCANLPEFNIHANGMVPFLQLPPLGSLQISNTGTQQTSKTGSRHTTTSASDATSVPSEGPTPSYPPQTSRQNSQSDDDLLPGPLEENDGIYGEMPIDNQLLEKSIEAALPPPLPRKNVDSLNRNLTLLSSAIESALPPRIPTMIPASSRLPQGFLDAAILSAMPSSSPFSQQSQSKNEMTGDRHFPYRHQRSPVNPKDTTNNLIECSRFGEVINDASHLDYARTNRVTQENDSNYEDDESSCTESSSENEPVTEVVIDLPSDVLEEVAASINVIDEQKPPTKSTKAVPPIPPRPSSSSTHKASKLRPPATRRTSTNGKTASVSPFTYKSEEKASPVSLKKGENRKIAPTSSNQMLVSTV